MLKLSSSRGVRIDAPVLSVSWSFEDHSVIIQALRIGLIEHEASDTGGVPRWKSSCPDRLAEATPIISGKLPSSGFRHYLWFISVCVGHLSAVFTPSRHCFYSTESIFYFFAACPIYPAKVSHYYRPTSVDTASVHIVKGITQNIHKRS